MADLGGLVRLDGSVVVPPAVASEVLRLLARALLTDARTHGARPTAAARALLDALYAASQHGQASDSRPASREDASGTIAGSVGEVANAGHSCSVSEAARRMGCSPQWIRHLLATGRLAGRRSAGVWLVDLPVARSQVPAAGRGSSAA